MAQAINAIIEGHVTDAHGRSVPGATVLLFPYGANVSGRLPETVTGEDGAYRLVTSIFGNARISAHKESAGYPNTVGLVFTSGEERFPEIEIKPGQRMGDVNVTLPPPDGIISGVVKSAKTGRPIPQARVTLSRADEPDVMYSSYLATDGSFRFALPRRPISIEVTASGFATWHFLSKETKQPYAELESDSRMELLIELDPE